MKHRSSKECLPYLDRNDLGVRCTVCTRNWGFSLCPVCSFPKETAARFDRGFVAAYITACINPDCRHEEVRPRTLTVPEGYFMIRGDYSDIRQAMKEGMLVPVAISDFSCKSCLIRLSWNWDEDKNIWESTCHGFYLSVAV